MYKNVLDKLPKGVNKSKPSMSQTNFRIRLVSKGNKTSNSTNQSILKNFPANNSEVASLKRIREHYELTAHTHTSET